VHVGGAKLHHKAAFHCRGHERQVQCSSRNDSLGDQHLQIFRIYQYVEPKRIKLLEANAKLDEANTKLTAVRQEVAELEEKLAKLTAQFEEATNEKNEAIAAAEKTQNKANMADRLVNGLADEKIRWTESIAGFEITEKNTSATSWWRQPLFPTLGLSVCPFARGWSMNVGSRI